MQAKTGRLLLVALLLLLLLAQAKHLVQAVTQSLR
jgi:hypothetical protein